MEKLEQKIKVKSPHGLHARPAALFVQIANKYDSSVRLEKDGEVADGKSIIALLSLGVNPGAEVKLVIEGSDAQEMFMELKRFLEKEHE